MGNLCAIVQSVTFFCAFRLINKSPVHELTVLLSLRPLLISFFSFLSASSPYVDFDAILITYVLRLILQTRWFRQEQLPQRHSPTIRKLFPTSTPALSVNYKSSHKSTLSTEAQAPTAPREKSSYSIAFTETFHEKISATWAQDARIYAPTFLMSTSHELRKVNFSLHPFNQITCSNTVSAGN